MDALRVLQQYPRTAAARALVQDHRLRNSAPAAIILLFDCDNLDPAAVHLHGLNDLLSKIKYLPHA
jgi:hypothetical protein